MNTLIVPCAGRSNRFPNMKPKWLLTHPDGSLMIEKALCGLDFDLYDRIIITIVRPHVQKYEASLILSQAFEDNEKVEICVLDDFTHSASETVFLTLEKMKVTGPFVVKDSDNFVRVRIPSKLKNAIVGCDVQDYPNITNLAGKSFLLLNEQNIIQDIIEKKVVSNNVCLGVYIFDNADLFKRHYLELLSKGINSEMFISHVISYILSKGEISFEAIFAEGYEDWGTILEWKEVQLRHRTYFVDVDGVLLKNCGKYGVVNWSNNNVFLEENIQSIKQLQDNGAQIVITTSRPESERRHLEQLLSEKGLTPHACVMGLNHAPRVLINDFAPTNPYPSGIAISLPRNADLKGYLE